jgi:hypothetical protein
MDFSCRHPGYVPLGILEYWNDGIPGYFILKKFWMIKVIIG